MYKYSFVLNSDLGKIIEENKNKYMISIEYLKTGNFVTFSDIPPVEYVLKEQGDKISILECENKALKEELTQIQTSIASLTSLITATLEEK